VNSEKGKCTGEEEKMYPAMYFNDEGLRSGDKVNLLLAMLWFANE